MRNYCDGVTISAPKYEFHNTHEGRRHLVMEFLEKDLEDYICEFPKGKQRDDAIQKMAVEMIDIVERFHNKTEHVHRDIKPPNFRVHKGKLYITDFGLTT